MFDQQRTSRRTGRKALLSGLLVAGLVGAAAPAQIASASAPRAPKPKVTEFTLGELSILTGPFAGGVASHRNAMTMAIEDLQKTKRFKINRVTGDCGSSPATAVAAFVAMKASNPLAIVGCPISSQTNAIAAEVSKAGIIHLAPNALLAKNLGDYKFNVFPPYAEYQVQPAVEQFYKKFKSSLKTAYYVAGKDYAVGLDTVAKRKFYFEKSGIQTVGSDEVLSTDTSYTALATKIASLNPSVLVEDSLSSIALLKAVRDAGYKGLIFGGAYVGNANFLTVQTGQFEGAYSFTSWLAEPLKNLSKSGKDFARRYKARFGVYPDAFAAGIYDGIRMLAEGVARAGGPNKGPAAITKATRKVTLADGVSTNGVVKFDANNVLPMNPVLIMVQNKTFVAGK